MDFTEIRHEIVHLVSDARAAQERACVHGKYGDALVARSKAEALESLLRWVDERIDQELAAMADYYERETPEAAAS